MIGEKSGKRQVKGYLHKSGSLEVHCFDNLSEGSIGRGQEEKIDWHLMGK